MRVVLKECAWESLGAELIVVNDPREAMTLADPDGQIKSLLDALSRGPADAAELAAELADQGVAVTVDDVQEGINGLGELGLLERAGEQGLGDPDVDERHFSNLTFFGAFADIDTSRVAFVRQLREAHVLTLGVGGAGSSIVQCLAGLGVGTLTLLDRDTIAPRNFARQFLYRHADIGRSKVSRAAEWVRAYDPAIDVRTVERWITGPADLADLTDGVDLIIGGLDGDARGHLWMNEAALRAGVPLVGGGMGKTQLTYCSVDPGMSPCLLCDESDVPDPSEPTPGGVSHRLSRSLPLNNALIGPTAMLLGSLMAFEALRYLTGFEPPHAAGSRVVLDLRTGLVPTWEPFPRDPDCTACALAPRRRDMASPQRRDIPAELP